MRKELPVLTGIEIAKPCPANWDSMAGNDVVRHCSLCRLNVYNISEMSQADALRLIQESEGRLCIRMYKREDGTVLTKDCPKGLAAFRRRVAKRFALAAALALTAFGCDKLRNRISGGSWETGDVTVPTTGKLACPPTKPTKAPKSGGKSQVELGEMMGKPKMPDVRMGQVSNWSK